MASYGIHRAAAPMLMLMASCAGEGRSADPCSAIDPVLASSSFVLVSAPGQGQRTASPMMLRGCSRTFESNVVWELRGRDGRLLSSGHATGGGLSGPAAFEARADFTVSEPEVGHLEVFERDESDGEGFPSPRTVVQVVLVPGQGAG